MTEGMSKSEHRTESSYIHYQCCHHDCHYYDIIVLIVIMIMNVVIALTVLRVNSVQ